MICYTEVSTVRPVGPFSLGFSSEIFMGLNHQVKAYSDEVFSQVLRIGDQLVLVKVMSQGTVQYPELRVEYSSNQPITTKTRLMAQRVVEYVFNLNFDLSKFYRSVENDAVMLQVSRCLYGFKYPTTPSVFESLVDSIVEQQISIKVARTIEERLALKFGDKLMVGDVEYYAFPTPQNIVARSIGDIQGCGLSQRKAEYIFGVARMIVEGELDLEEMKNCQDIPSVIGVLDGIKGVGIWTAELTVFRGMQRLEVLPADDIGIRRAVSKYYCGGKLIKGAETREIAKLWGKWQGLAAFYLLAAEFLGITV